MLYSLLLALVFLLTQSTETYWVTGYNRLDPAMNTRTADGTHILTDEPIVAASYNLPFDTIIEIEGLGVYRVADRGHLRARHIDVAVWSNAEAYAITGYYKVRVLEWGHEDKRDGTWIVQTLSQAMGFDIAQ
jgi:3D (Asp-Asp-Asp) domain-containing protein